MSGHKANNLAYKMTETIWMYLNYKQSNINLKVKFDFQKWHIVY